MTRRKYVLFALVAIGLSLVLSSTAVVVTDLYLHRKYAGLVGLNIWGYRGPAIGRKQPNEWRLAVLGESTAFGYGVRWDEAFPVYLQRRLNGDPKTGRPVTVVNLAYNNEGAHSYKFTLRDYGYLKADAVLFYSGYNDLGGANLQVFRHESPVFRATGYLPIFPMIFQEKARVLRHGSVGDAADGQPARTTFRPNITARAGARALETAVAVEESLTRQLDTVSGGSPDEAAAKDGASCGERWAHYCGEMAAAVGIALNEGKRVLLVTQPYMLLNDRAVAVHREQQGLMHDFLRRRFGDDARIHYADLGAAVDMRDPQVCYDGMHLTARGNQTIAAALAPYVHTLMK